MKNEDNNTTYEIPIKEGHDSSSYFWIVPVIVKNEEELLLRQETFLDDEISIEEDYVFSYLAPFLKRHFDENHWCNIARDRVQYGETVRYGFEWHDDNFYYYDRLELMLCEIELVARLLEIDYDNPILDKYKENYSIYFLLSNEERAKLNARGGGNHKKEIEKRKDRIIDFYRRFVSRVRKMMENYPETNMIDICGP